MLNAAWSGSGFSFLFRYTEPSTSRTQPQPVTAARAVLACPGDGLFILWPGEYATGQHASQLPAASCVDHRAAA